MPHRHRDPVGLMPGSGILAQFVYNCLRVEHEKGLSPLLLQSELLLIGHAHKVGLNYPTGAGETA